MRFDSFPFGRPEELNEPAVVATYLASGTSYGEVLARAGSFAVGQSIGTWVEVPGISEGMIRHYQARVLSVMEAGPEAEDMCSRFVLRIAFPMVNFGGSLTMLLTALVGNDVSTALRARLVDLEFVCGGTENFSGPSKGIAELRELTGVWDRPLVLNMIKPCAGFTPAEGAKLFEQVALGGVDLIKDDELLASPDYNPVLERYRAYAETAKAVFEKTGRRPLYLPNLSGTPSQVMECAAALCDAGAKACLVNFVFGGLDTLLELTRRFGDRLFILGHYAGAAVMSGRDSGIANHVMLGVLPRLAGAHGVMTMAPQMDVPATLFDFWRTVQAQRLPMGPLAPMTATVGGGITPVSQAVYQRELGADAIIGIGGAIQGHPMGARAGAQAAMAAVKATAQGIPLREAAVCCEPLAQALRLWSGEGERA